MLSPCSPAKAQLREEPWSIHGKECTGICSHQECFTEVSALRPTLVLLGILFSKLYFKIKGLGASLVAQWLGVRLPMQGTRVRALVREDPTCRRAAGPVSHNY